MRISSAVMTACAMLAGVNAQAASQAQISVSGLKYELVDLNAADGVAPSFSYGDNYVPNYYSNVTNVQTWGTQNYPVPDYAGKGVYNLIQLPAPLNLPSASDESVWLGGHAKGSIGADSQGSFISLDAALIGVGTYSATTGSDMSAILSPFTELVMTAHVSSSVGISGACYSVALAPYYCDNAGANFYFEAASWKQQENGVYYLDIVGALSSNVVTVGQIGVPLTGARNEDLVVRYANWTDKPIAVQFREYAQLGGESQIATVPEPAELTLVLSGIAVVGVMGSRGRKRKSQKA
ncbi:MAG: hypothetical protein HY836_03080 [Aquabacterium sp.]|uniref:hypothetical protein n=1 Tax=Aquabacterium sp. TaxID=1872578 RepID=UPI0025BDC0BD|nr:hypothetical protein [Aquabacterium sp.]MBI5924558.1 hypothetical protein [Aquabacterium sp.]